MCTTMILTPGTTANGAMVVTHSGDDDTALAFKADAAGMGESIVDAVFERTYRMRLDGDDLAP